MRIFISYILKSLGIRYVLKTKCLGLWALFIFVLVTCPVLGQSIQKKQLTAADYAQWGTLFVEELSEKGNWVSYAMRYEELQTDTLYLKNTKTKETIIIPKTTTGKFNQEEQFACLTPQGVLEINLKTAKKQLINNAEAFTFSANGKYLLITKKESNNQKSLEIKTSNGKTIKTIENIDTYKLHELSNKLVYTIKTDNCNAVILLHLNNSLSSKKIMESSKYIFTNPTWNSLGTTLAFFEQSSDETAAIKNKIGYYNYKENKLCHFSMEENSNRTDAMQIDLGHNIPLTISDDGQKVFFGIKEKDLLNKINDPETVQIWKSNDNWIYPQQKKIQNWKKTVKTALWNIATNQFLAITDVQYPKLMLDGKQQWALVFNPMATKSNYKRDDDRDYYVKNLITGESQLVIKQQPTNDQQILAIPHTNNVIYYKDKNWWVLNLSTQRVKNLTEKLNINFEDINYDKAGDKPSYGIAAWNKTNNSILIYDQYDIWEISMDGKKVTRLTSGKENQICFRIPKRKNGTWDIINFDGLSCSEVDLDEGLILEATDDNTMASGYYSWYRKDKESKIFFADKKIDQLFKASKNNSYVFCEQDYNSPPNLLFKDKKSSKSVSKQPTTL
ncbi:hypothetical protein D3C84_182700 [compost metagenome]